MPKSFSDIWGEEGSPKLSLKDSLRLTIRGKVELRKKVIDTIVALKRCIRVLDARLNSFKAMVEKAYAEASRAYAEGDEERTKMLLNEAAMVKKTWRLMSFFGTCLRIMVSRLETIVTVGDVVSQARPVLRVVRVLSPIVSRALPELRRDLELVQNMLEQVCGEAEANITPLAPVEIESKEAMDMYEAIKLSSEKEAELSFPELPTQKRHGKVRTL